MPAIAGAMLPAVQMLAGIGPRFAWTDGNLEVQYCGRIWSINASCFGPAARIDIVNARPEVAIRRASFPGLDGSYTLRLLFEPANRAIRILSDELGVASDSIPFARFLAEGLSLGSLPHALARLLGRAGWSQLPSGAGLLLDRDFTWQVSANGLMRQTSGLSASHLALRVRPPGKGAFDELVEEGGGWSSELRADRPNGLPTDLRWRAAGLNVRLMPQALAAVLGAVWQDGRIATALRGNWSIDAKTGRREWAGIKVDGGWVVEGRDRRGLHRLARLTIAQEAHEVALPGGLATVRGSSPAHLFAFAAGAARDPVCSLRAGILSIPLKVDGADYSQIEFDETDYCDVLLGSGEPPPANYDRMVSTTSFFGRWYIPMDGARLRVARARDHLSLSYHFRNLALVWRVRRWGWGLERIDRGGPVRMAVEFPPQHVMEEAAYLDPDSNAVKAQVPLDEVRAPAAEAKAKAERMRRDPDFAAAQGSPPPDRAQQGVPRVAEARLSGPSLVVFDLAGQLRGRRVRMPISISGLTRWDDLPLAIAPGAATTMTVPEVVIDPATGLPQIDPTTRQQVMTTPVPETDPLKIAAHHWRLLPGEAPPRAYPERIEKIVANIAPRPATRSNFTDHTWLELPARLGLSPDQHGRFRTDTPSLRNSPWGKNAVPLWSARLDGNREVRAIGSDDFRPEYFRARAEYPNNHKTPSAWHTKPTRFPTSMRDRHELVALTVGYGLPVIPRLAHPDWFLKEPEAGDGVPQSGVVKKTDPYGLADSTDDTQGLYIPSAMPIQELRLTSLGGSLGMAASFEPPASLRFRPPASLLDPNPDPVNFFDALTIESWNQRTNIGRDQFVEVVYKGFLYPYGHRAALVKRTERRIFPRPKASAETVTADDGKPTAYLFQRYFIRITEPEKQYAALDQPFASRDWPCSSITFVKRQSPDLVDPYDEPPVDENGIRENGAVEFGVPTRGLVFWPRTGREIGKEVAWEVEIGGQEGTMTAPLMFLDNTAAHDADTVKAAEEHYLGLIAKAAAAHLRCAEHKGAERHYARESRPRAATFATRTWVLGGRGRDAPGNDRYAFTPAMEGADQPPFYPFMAEAHVDLRPVQAFSGKTDRLSIVSFDSLYSENGFTDRNPSQIFLAVHGRLPANEEDWRARSLEAVRMNLSGDGANAGGVAQPNLRLVGLSMVSGPVGGKADLPRKIWPEPIPNPARAAATVLAEGAAMVPAILTAPPADVPANGTARDGIFSGVDFFPDDAKLLGIVPLSQIVKAALYTQAPELMEQAEAAAENLIEQAETLRQDLQEQAAEILSNLDELKPPLEFNTPLGKVSELYPKLATAVDALLAARDKLTTQLGAPINSPPDWLSKTASAAKTLNSAAGNLLNELDRVAGSPIPLQLTDFVNSLNHQLRSLRPQTLFGAFVSPLRTQAKKSIEAYLNQDAALFLAIALGPDAYDVLAGGELNEALGKLASTAAEGLCYELIGEPALKAVGQLAKLEQLAGDADPRELLTQILTLFETTLTAVERAVTPQGLTQIACTATGGWRAQLASLTTDRSQVLIDSADQIGSRLAALEAVVADLAAIESTYGGVPGDLDLAVLQRLRSELGTLTGQVRQLHGGMQSEAEKLSKWLGSVCSADGGNSADQFLGGLSRWLNLQIQIVRHCATTFRHAAEALNGPLPTRAGLAGVQVNPVGKVIDALEKLRALLEAFVPLVAIRRANLKQMLKDSVHAAAQQLVSSDYAGDVSKAIDRFEAIATQLDNAMGKLQTDLAAAAKAAEAAGLEALRSALDVALPFFDEIERFPRDVERQLLAYMLGPVAAQGQAAQDALLAQARNLTAKAFECLIAVYDLTVSPQAPANPVKPLELLYDKLSDAKVKQILGYLLTPEIKQTLLTDFVTPIRDERHELQASLDAVSNSASLIDDLRKEIIGWRNRFAAIRSVDAPGQPVLYRTLRDLVGLLDRLLHGRLQEIIDFQGIRRQAEAALLSLVLPKVTLSYSFGTNLEAYPPVFDMVRDPAMKERFGGDTGSDAKDLSLSFSAVLDPANPGASRMVSKGVLQPFQIDLFQVVTIFFNKTEFSSGPGSSGKLDIKVADVVLGEAVKFIQQLQETLGLSNDSGFYLTPSLNPPGITAGFAINLGTISIGAVSFLNVNFGASVELPFDSRPALFRFNLARRDSPFIINAFPFGGGGSLSLLADGGGLKGFEASFEYGGVAAFGFGPLRGQGRITTGIYIVRTGTSARLSGFFVAAGSAHIACFSVSACLLVTVEQEDGGALKGNASYTFGFSIGIKDFTYRVPVSRLIPQGWSGGSGGRAALSNPQSAVLALAASVAAATVKPTSRALSMESDWKTWQSYFEGDL